MDQINASDFKARCLAILDHVSETGAHIVILKRGKPVAELGPVTGTGAGHPQTELEGTVTVLGDIMAPVVPADDWESNR